MAIWQYSFFVVPRDENNEAIIKIDRSEDEDGWLDDEYAWQLQPTKPIFFQQIEKILPKRKSWSDNIILYGFEDSNRFEVLKNEFGFVDSVSFRISFISDYELILKGIINFIKSHDLAILDENLEELELNFTTIHFHILNSQKFSLYRKLSNQ